MKKVVVTGGSSGIGLKLCRLLLDRGVGVISIDINDSSIAHTNHSHHLCDLSDDVATSNCFREIFVDCDEICGLVCLAGKAFKSKIKDLTANDFDEQIRINLSSVYFTIKNCYEHLSDGSSIVTISSVSSYGGLGSSLAYGAAKAGVIGLTKNLAVELIPKGIRVNCIVPGPVDTPLFRGLSTPTERRLLQQVTPSKRLGREEDVNSLIYFLLSEQSSHILGQVINIDGGLSMAYKPYL